MPDNTFPAPACSPEPFDTTPIDNTMRSKKEAGYVSTRQRFTRQTYIFGPISYPVLLAAEAAAIKSHDDAVGGWKIFPWTHTELGTTHQVRYGENGRPKFKRVGTGGLRSCSFTLEEA
ncbi:MAG: hypothetical protein A2X58_08600 [Nitrospirae bacterium GWC2_56_14]|nr:MAG: hypothetical protein A2X58_08600 [Nitrospirae bacterium GWC2_56_14]